MKEAICTMKMEVTRITMAVRVIIPEAILRLLHLTAAAQEAQRIPDPEEARQIPAVEAEPIPAEVEQRILAEEAQRIPEPEEARPIRGPAGARPIRGPARRPGHSNSI